MRLPLELVGLVVEHWLARETAAETGLLSQRARHVGLALCKGGDRGVLQLG